MHNETPEFVFISFEPIIIVIDQKLFPELDPCVKTKDDYCRGL